MEVCRKDNPDEFIRLLMEHNRQRVKSLDEVVREEVVSTSPEVAYKALLEHRKQDSDMSGFSELTSVENLPKKRRAAFSKGKWHFIDAVIEVVEGLRKFLPISDRQIHYALLNNPPMKGGTKRSSRYANDLQSYHDLTDVLTRLRLDGTIPWEYIVDETRPVLKWDVHKTLAPFLRRELERFLGGYRRDYIQSQPCHIEVVAEKLTLKGILKPVVSYYGIPLTIGRGFSSTPPRHDMAERFEKSGKDRLVVLILSDFDPDGETIAESFKRSMRDDFGIESIEAFKVALNAGQVEQFDLPSKMKAKKGSATRKRFVNRFGDNVFELEALRPDVLQRLLTEAIDSVIDAKAFNAELDAEKAESVKIEAYRAGLLKASQSFMHNLD